MGVFRVHKEERYTNIDNNILQSKDLSLKAIGLLSKMLSLPDDWNYSLMGLVAICKDGRAAIESALDELEEAGYVIRTQDRDAYGKFHGWNYDIFESPQSLENTGLDPYAENPHTDKPHAENPLQQNNNIQNTNITNSMYVGTQEPEAPKERETFAEIIDELVLDQDVKFALGEYIKMRAKKHNAPTNYALRLMIKTLQTYSNDAAVQLEIVENAIMGGYNTFFFPAEKPKEEKKPQFHNFNQRDLNYSELEKAMLGTG